MNYIDAYKIVLGHEGGYVNDPKDSGGETMKGISRRYHPEWTGWPIIDTIKKNYPRASWSKVMDADASVSKLVQDFYKGKYWTPLMLDEIAPALRFELFDTAINMGRKTAVTFLQRSLNVLNRGAVDYPDIEADGKIGRNTVAAANASRDMETLLKVLNCLQGAHYVELAERSPKNERFMRGWINRRVQL
jgi:lysozyme family protein